MGLLLSYPLPREKCKQRWQRRHSSRSPFGRTVTLVYMFIITLHERSLLLLPPPHLETNIRPSGPSPSPLCVVGWAGGRRTLQTENNSGQCVSVRSVCCKDNHRDMMTAADVIFLSCCAQGCGIPGRMLELVTLSCHATTYITFHKRPSGVSVFRFVRPSRSNTRTIAMKDGARIVLESVLRNKKTAQSYELASSLCLKN